jgi:hypothetical protein
MTKRTHNNKVANWMPEEMRADNFVQTNHKVTCIVPLEKSTLMLIILRVHATLYTIRGVAVFLAGVGHFVVLLRSLSHAVEEGVVAAVGRLAKRIPFL